MRTIIKSYGLARGDGDMIAMWLAYGIAKSLTDKILGRTKKYEVRRIIAEIIPDDLIDLYLRKLIFAELVPVAQQVILDQIQNEGEPKNAWVIRGGLRESVELVIQGARLCRADLHELSGLPMIHRWPRVGYIVFLLLRTVIRKRLWRSVQKSRDLEESGDRPVREKSVVGIKYNEGIDPEKRNDLFWLERSSLSMGSILIYFERRFGREEVEPVRSTARFLEEHKIPWRLVLPKRRSFIAWIKPSYRSSYNAIRRKLVEQKNVDPLERALARILKDLLLKANNWAEIFARDGVKISIDTTEYGLTSLEKSMAIYLNGGLSIGRLRSYMASIPGHYSSYYTNDVFFLWGIDAVRRYRQSDNRQCALIITGFSYGKPRGSQKDAIANVGRRLKRAGVTKTILLLDAASSSHNHDFQRIDIGTMENYYQGFIDLVMEKEEVGLIVKPKRYENLKRMSKIMRQLTNLESQGWCHVERNPFQLSASVYANHVDLAVGTGIQIPSALLEVVVSERNGKRGIIFDYANLRTLEADLYRWGERKVIFNELGEMMVHVRSYLENGSEKSELGDWSEHLNELDPFRDGRGPERVGSYIGWLNQGLSAGLARSECISMANRHYRERWGAYNVIDADYASNT
jgi:hypothetical protein